MQLRTMQYQDIAQVVQIEKQVQYSPWSRAQFLSSLDSHVCSVLVQRDTVVGFCIFQQVLDEANLLLIAVHPHYQGQGLGYRLLTESMQQLVGCQYFFLDVRESNRAAIALYEKVGFHQIDLRKNYYPASGAKKEHAVIMSCEQPMEDVASFFGLAT